MKIMAPLAACCNDCPGHFVVAVATEHCVCSGNRTNQESGRRGVCDHAQCPGFPTYPGMRMQKVPICCAMT